MYDSEESDYNQSLNFKYKDHVFIEINDVF